MCPNAPPCSEGPEIWTITLKLTLTHDKSGEVKFRLLMVHNYPRSCFPVKGNLASARRLVSYGYEPLRGRAICKGGSTAGAEEEPWEMVSMILDGEGGGGGGAADKHKNERGGI